MEIQTNKSIAALRRPFMAIETDDRMINGNACQAESLLAVVL
jgi:hypothetical protein